MTVEIINYNGTAVDAGADITLFARKSLSEESVNKLLCAFEHKYADMIVISAAKDGEGLYYDPVTMNIAAASFEGFAVGTALLKDRGGLDKSLGESAASDLAARLIAGGKTVRYLPVRESFSLSSARGNDDKTPDFAENLLLRAKHGSPRQFREGAALILRAVKHPDIYAVNRKRLIMLTFKNAFRICRFLLKKSASRGMLEFQGAVCGFSRGPVPEISSGAARLPKVSVVVRTYRRPALLKRALQSLERQTYANFEVVVIEDGKPENEKLVREAFPDLEIRYHAMNENSGRAGAAAKGVEIAKGEYVNFLDDDDFLFPEYLSAAVSAAESAGCDIVFSSSVALEAETVSEEPLLTKVKNKRLMNFGRIDALSMLRRCQVPCNAVLFKKKLYSEVGGIREDLGAHEDWSLWLRMMTVGSFTSLAYAAACFTVSADPKTEKRRLESYGRYDGMLFEDDRLTFSLTAKELKQNYDGVIHDMMYLKQRGELDAYIDAEYEKITKK